MDGTQLGVFDTQAEVLKFQLVGSSRHLLQATIIFICAIRIKEMRSLEKRALDSLIDQLLESIPGAHIVGPGAPLTALDEKYVGTLNAMLQEAMPGIPDGLLSSVRDELIVVQRAREEPSSLMRWEPSVMRVVKNIDASEIQSWQETYSDILSIDIRPSKYLETDLKNASLTFSEQFFAPRSIQSWRKLSLHFARTCDAMARLMVLSKLKQRDVTHEDHGDSHLIHTNLVSANGDALELTAV